VIVPTQQLEILSIQTERLILRPLNESDIASFEPIYGDEETMQYLGVGACAKSPEETANSIRRKIQNSKSNDFGLWAVELKEENRVIGHCGLAWFDLLNSVEVAYVFSKDHWGKGYATEGITASLDYGFSALILDKIVAIVHPNNTGSRRALEKSGMVYDHDTAVRDLPVMWYETTLAQFYSERKRAASYRQYSANSF
jgi:[ribosomal protein S5]-alanine N-acetyltransferase